MAKKLHKDVEILVDGRDSQPSLEKAVTTAFTRCVSDGDEHEVSVHFQSKFGARYWGGDDAVESYLEDPEASSHESYVIRVDSRGRVA